MGYDAVWTRDPDGAQFLGRVLFREPTQDEKLAGGDNYNYTPRDFYMEYRIGVFAGLFEIVREGDTGQEVDISGATYYVRTVEAKYDGQTFIAKLHKKDA